MEKPMSEVQTQPIVIANQLESKATFAVVQSDGSQVYVPSTIGKVVNLNVGEAYDAILIPNTHHNSDKIPWMAIKINPEEGGQEPPKARQDDFADVLGAFYGLEFPVTAEELGVPRAGLERAWRKSKVIKIEARQSPDDEAEVLWAENWDVV